MELKDITKPVTTIPADATFTAAVSLMIEKQTNVLLVTDVAGHLIGVVSVTDLLDAVVPEYLDDDSTAAHFATEEMFETAVRDAADMPVEEFMTRDVSTVHEHEKLMSVAVTAMASKRFRIPVVDNDGRPVGIISRQGLKHIIATFLNTPQGE